MIEEVEYQNQHGQHMHSRNEFQNSGSMQMPSHGGHGMMKPHMHTQAGYMPGHNGGYMTHQQPMGSGMMHQQPMGSGMMPMSSGMMHQSPMGHCSAPNMSSTTMNSTNFSSGGMMGGPNMSRTEYDSFQKVNTPGGMHESKYHHQEQSGYGHGHMSGGMGYGMPGYGGGRKAEWATKAL